MAQVDLHKVIKEYGSTRVVHDASLSIKDNEFIVMVGPSGCGKSTLLRMIAGLESVSGGEIRIGGRPVNEVAPKDRNVAMVFQNYALYPHLSVFDNMGFGLKMAGVPKRELRQKVEEAAAILELTPYLRRKPAELSGGQRQRVAMGRAIVRRPSVFLFDEPLSNLDAQLRTQMRMELKKLHLRLRTTTIYVTHDQVEAMTLADRIVILHNGRIQQVGTPIEVFERPVNSFVASFIGNPPITMLRGRCLATSPTIKLGFGSLRLDTVLQKSVAEGMEVVVGIRPDALHRLDSDNLPAGWWPLAAEVVVAEILGGQTLVEVTCGGETMVAELSGRLQLRPGESLDLGLDTRRLLLFDPETGQTL